MDKDISCEDTHAPCVLSDSYKESIAKYVIQRPKRHAMDDCTKAVPIARAQLLGVMRALNTADLVLICILHSKALKAQECSSPGLA